MFFVLIDFTRSLLKCKSVLFFICGGDYASLPCYYFESKTSLYIYKNFPVICDDSHTCISFPHFQYAFRFSKQLLLALDNPHA